MTVGTYTALGWRWSRIGGSGVAHLVPRYPGPLSRSACGRQSAHDRLLEDAMGLGTIELCSRCQDKNGTAGARHDGRREGFGQ